MVDSTVIHLRTSTPFLRRNNGAAVIMRELGHTRRKRTMVHTSVNFREYFPDGSNRSLHAFHPGRQVDGGVGSTFCKSSFAITPQDYFPVLVEFQRKPVVLLSRIS
ncbi:hypothetical protein PM082_004662 [Marasmius tenuissimus]|nr:hypothetical protein PM082_004662 [Marasmius tenuissimus]